MQVISLVDPELEKLYGIIRRAVRIQAGLENNSTRQGLRTSNWLNNWAENLVTPRLDVWVDDICYIAGIHMGIEPACGHCYYCAFDYDGCHQCMGRGG